MEYSLLKSISTPLPYLKPEWPYLKPTSTPGKDLVNPGIAQATKLFSYYIPLIPVKNPYEIAKIDTKESKVEEQAGFGESHQSNNDTNIENLEEKDSEIIEKNDDDTVEVEDAKEDQVLPTGILESFKHPKIQIGKEVIRQISKPNYSKTAIKKSKSMIKHKFKFA